MIRPKILHTADWHLGATLAGHSRLPEQYDAIDEMVDIALEEQVTAFLIAGDFFDKRLSFRKGSEVAAQAARRLVRLAEARIPIILLAGNHDPPEWFTMLREIVEITAVRAGHADERPFVVVQDASIERVGGVQFVCLPYPAREIVAAENGHDFSEEDDPILERNRAVTEKLRQVLHMMVDSPRFKPNIPAIFTAHFTMANAAIPGHEAQEPGGFQHDFIKDFILPASAVPNRFVYGAFGHIHLPQDLHTTKHGRFPFPARYCGSPLRLNTGEREEEKSVTVVEIRPDNSVDIKVRPLTQTPMERLELKVTDLDALEKDSSRFANSYCRVTLEHDGTIPEVTLRQRLVRLFPKHVGVDLKGPRLSVRDKNERLAVALGLRDVEQGGVGWNIDDHTGTVEAYLAETLDEHPDKKATIQRAIELTKEYERIHYGVPEEEAIAERGLEAPADEESARDDTEATMSPEDLGAARMELRETGEIPAWFRVQFPGVTAEKLRREPRQSEIDAALTYIDEHGELPPEFAARFPDLDVDAVRERAAGEVSA